jgi:enterochelin esterase-like enzyme
VVGATSGASGSGGFSGAGGENTGGQGGGSDASTADGDASGDGDARTADRGVIVSDAGSVGDGNFMISRPFMPAPEMSDQPGVPKGRIIRFTLPNSMTFGDGTRAVAVYLPAGYVSGTEVPFMVAEDGVAPQNGGSFGLDDLRPLMDNMIAGGKLPAMAGVFVDPAGQRSVEYDTVSDKYYRFVEDELLPAVVTQVMMQASLALNLTKDPEGRGAFGGSSGGSCAFTMGWFHPESYRRILTLSGSFTPLQRSMMYPDGAADYHMHLIPESDAKPLRVFLEAGTNDIQGWKAANDAMAMALAAKMYHYRYVVANGATHEDDGARRQYLPDAMAWLWQGYPIK